MQALILFFTIVMMLVVFLKTHNPKKKSIREMDFNYRPMVGNTGLIARKNFFGRR